MGTRHLIKVIHNGEVKIAQYGQWDGNLSGQGLTILKFLRKFGTKKEWLTAIDKCSFYMSDDEIWENYPELKDNIDTPIPPELSRDTGADILKFVYDAKGQVKLVNNSEFIHSFACQYHYVIDMDNLTFGSYSKTHSHGVYSLIELPTDEDYISPESE